MADSVKTALILGNCGVHYFLLSSVNIVIGL